MARGYKIGDIVMVTNPEATSFGNLAMISEVYTGKNSKYVKLSTLCKMSDLGYPVPDFAWGRTSIQSIRTMLKKSIGLVKPVSNNLSVADYCEEIISVKEGAAHKEWINSLVNSTTVREELLVNNKDTVTVRVYDSESRSSYMVGINLKFVVTKYI